MYQRGYAADPIEEEDECEDEESVHEDPDSYDAEGYVASVCDPDSAALADEYEYHAVPAEGIIDAYGNWWTSNEESLDQQNACLAEDDDEYNQVLITFHQAKEAFRNARAAR